MTPAIVGLALALALVLGRGVRMGSLLPFAAPTWVRVSVVREFQLAPPRPARFERRSSDPSAREEETVAVAVHIQAIRTLESTGKHLPQLLQLLMN